ncbi:MAG: DUF4349 domain-containing protein [Oscillospiraceae bacterium]|nr:DUF4349 domain-containing protein [Oscillospiraceae bacterium]
MKKTIAIALSVLFLLTALVGCGAAREPAYADEDNGAAVYEYGRMPEDFGYDAELAVEAANGTAPADVSPVSVATNRKLIRTVSLGVETEEYDVLLNGIAERISLCGGYVENMSADTRYSSDSRYATLTVRVPADRLDEFVTAVSGISNVVQRSENTEDVTLSYVDLESHTAALRTEQERLIELLEQAENVSEILEIEDRLAYVRYELEYMQSQLRTYDNLVEYATVTLSVSEVTKLTPTVEKGFWEKIGDGFNDSLNGVWEGLKSFFSFLIIALPYLVVIAVFAGIAVVIIVLCVKKSRKRAAKRTARTMPQPPVMQYPPVQPPAMPADSEQKNRE